MLQADEHLVRRATEGDERAFAAIFRRYHQDLYRYCAAIVGDSQDAQDALQNTMVKVLRALPGERRQIELKPWLYRIAHNEAIEVVRHRGPAAVLDPERPAAAPGPAESAEERARLRRLVADVAALPERQRGALVMRELADLEFEQIGEALETSAAVARQTLYEARLGLRQMEEGRELSCDTVMRALSDADGRVTRRRDQRAHLRECAGCRQFRDELHARRANFAALAPLPAAAAAGLLQSVLGTAGGGAGAAAGAAGGAAGTAGSAAVAGKAAGVSALGASALAKSAAVVVVAAAIGVKTADRAGFVDAGLPGGDKTSKSAPARTAPAATPGVGAGAPASAGSGAGGAVPGRSDGAGPSRNSQSKPGETRGKGTPSADIDTAPDTAATATPGPRETQTPGASGAHREDAAKGTPPPPASQGQETAAAHKGGAASKGNGGRSAGAPGHTKASGTGAKQGQGGGGKSAAAGAHGASPPAQSKGQSASHPAPHSTGKPPSAPTPPEPAAPPGPESPGGGKPASPPGHGAGPPETPPDLS